MYIKNFPRKLYPRLLNWRIRKLCNKTFWNRLIASIICIVCSLVFLSGVASAQETGGNIQVLTPTPKTVAWGYYAANTPPALRVKSGDVVEVHTLITSTPPRLEGAGVKPEQVEASL